MKIVLAGAFGKLGTLLLKKLVEDGHEVIAADMINKNIDGVTGYKSVIINATDPASLTGLCDGVDLVITTVGLTQNSTSSTNYDIDLTGNLNIMLEAQNAGVKHFDYVSIVRADEETTVPMLDAKASFEGHLKNSGMNYTIFRPTGYFEDIYKLFKPMVDRGQANLIGDGQALSNVVSREDLADFISKHLLDQNKIYTIGGKETYSYEQLANMCFEASGKEANIYFDSPDIYEKLALVNRLKRNGKEALLRFSKWTMTNDLLGDTRYGKDSLKEYIQKSFKE